MSTPNLQGSTIVPENIYPDLQYHNNNDLEADADIHDQRQLQVPRGTASFPGFADAVKLPMDEFKRLPGNIASLRLILKDHEDQRGDSVQLQNLSELDLSRGRLPSNISHISTAQCRICFSVHPCACDGSIRFCHPECLLQWVRQSGSFVCELCKTRYSIRRSGLKKCTQWRMPATDSIDWIHLVIFFFSVFFIVGSIIWMTWLGLGQRMSVLNENANYSGARMEETSGGTLGDFMVPAFILYSIIDILFLFIAGMELIFTIAPLVRKWYRMNQTLVIENHDHASNNTPRVVNANAITATTTDGQAMVNLHASIPCVSQERERVVQEHSL